MAKSVTASEFDYTIRSLRDTYEKKRNNTNAFPPFDRPLVDMEVRLVNGSYEFSWWYQDEQSQTRFLRVYYVPGTLAGNILRLRANIPPLSGDCEINDNDIRSVPDAPPPPPEEDYEDDTEDVSAQLALLPVVPPSEDTYFFKKPKYSSEITNLLKCQGGSCPGIPLSPNIIQLLGRTDDGRLVFPKMSPRASILGRVHSLETYKSWLLQLFRGLRTLHGLGIVHRDLRIENVLWSEDTSTLVICDLESRWGNRDAPEILRNDSLDAGWNAQSDVWDIGNFIKGLLYGNAPINVFMLEEWQVPAPFTVIYEACRQTKPEERASLDELIRMAEAI